MKHMRTIASLALALALVVPGVASAATAPGTTSETLEVPSSISLTVPASLDYGSSGINRFAAANITAATSHGAGMTVSIAVNADGAGKIARASRSTDIATGLAGDLVATSAMTAADFAAPFVIVQSTGPVTGGTATIGFNVSAAGLAGGTYTGQIDWVAATK